MDCACSSLQWEEFLKLGDEVETSVVEEKIKSQRPEHCALLIYTVSYGNMLAMGHQIAIKCKVNLTSMPTVGGRMRVVEK